MSKPVVVAGRLAAYTVNHGHLFLSVFDPESGRVVTGVNASGSEVTPGVGLDVVHDGRRVVFFERAALAGEAVRLSAYDVRRRRVVWRSRRLAFTSQPDRCDHNRRFWCVTGATEDGRGALWQLNPRTGRLRVLAHDVNRPLGAGLYQDGPRLVGVVGGKVRWRRAAAALMRGRFDPDFGWAWTTHDDLVVGHLGRVISPPRGRRRIPYPSARIAATGRTRWIRPGHLGCLPGPLKLLVRCQMTGTIVVEDNRVVDNTRLRTTISRLDPETEKSLSSLPAGRWAPLTDSDLEWVTLSDGRVAGRRDGPVRHVAIDIEDGSVTAVPGHAVGWCEVSYDFRDLSSFADRRWTTVHQPCRVDGRPVRLPSYPSKEFGEQVGDVFAWTDRRGLHAVRVQAATEAATRS